MNYKIILDQEELDKFIDWLPELQEGECYYLTLFARKKYHESAKNDKSQCGRSTASSKEWLLKKIRKMELPQGTYTNKDGTPVHSDSLALYITVNPRSFALAQRLLLKKLASTVADNGCNMNPASMAMSSIQKAKSRTVYVDFDFDTDGTFASFEEHPINDGTVPYDCFTTLHTRGGFHVLVDPLKIPDYLKNNWYKLISSMDNCDVSGDNLIPVAGCTQGGYMPWLHKL